MVRIRRISRLLGVSVVATLFAAGALGQQPSKPLLTKQVDPKEFGITDDTITVISAVSFTPKQVVGNDYFCAISPSFGLSCDPNFDVHFYAPLNLPAGVVIDRIGFNSLSDTDGVLGVELWSRNSGAGLNSLAAFSVPAHGWGTDYDDVSISLGNHVNAELVLDVENASNPHLQFFAWVEIWWHRTVSPPPATADFTDVPPSNQFFRFVEALYHAGITAGYGDGRFGVNDPLTRGQMAVFLSTALGLHWPD